MSRAAALREHDDTTNADHIVVFHDVSWEDYERLLAIRGDHPVPRISYLEGEAELMTPSKVDRDTLTDALRDFRRALDKA
jgi:hypothetical protein